MNKTLCGDVIEKLKELPDECVQMVVTSPPYFGLRDYGVKGQIGLEDSPEAFVSKMVEVFREVRRVLRNDGTVWMNIGDSYAMSSMRGKDSEFKGWCDQSKSGIVNCKRSIPKGLKPKDLIGVPWRLAFALQADGWTLRQDIIWEKAAPMPESVTDRCTKSHEYIFLLSKSQKYFFDNEAIKEPCVTYDNIVRDRETTKLNNTPGRTKMKGLVYNNYPTRNKRDVWKLKSNLFKGAHFATFPLSLPLTCIKAGTSEAGCCGKCGSPWTRILKKRTDWPERKAAGQPIRQGLEGAGAQGVGGFKSESTTLGWKQGCKCGETTTARCVVLDPFAGAFTTAVAARDLGRDSIMVELNPEYVKIGEERLKTK